MNYKKYLEIAIITLLTIYVVKNYVPSVATMVGL